MAWPTDRRPSDALTGEFVPQMWSAKVLDHVKSNLVCVNAVNTTWKSELKIGDKVWIPLLAAMTGAAVDVTTTGVLTNMNTTVGGTDVFITVDTWWEVPWQLDDSVKLQTQVGDLAEKAAANCAYALEKKIDTDVNALFSTLTSSTVYGTDGQTFTDDIMIALMELLDEADVPRTDRSLIVDPSTVADIYKIDKFMTYDYSRKTFSTDGYVGTLPAYNVPVFVTNNLTAVGSGTGSYGALIHRDAIGLVIQDGPTVEKWREPKRHSDIINVSAVFGSDVLRTTFGKSFYTRLA
ncbi:hypothetical protein LCGC14_0567300 [marine sediment metagenome]|uniref:Capsid protein n=1 Tax=marine sediment metagenome TaxID=412755 RepID=A0A0F9UTI0_9ZZZZ